MKPCSSTTLTIMSGGMYLIAGLYDITLQNGLVIRVTDFDIPLSAAIYPSATKNTYSTGLTIERGSITSQVGLDVQEMDLTLSPQQDAPVPVLFSGYPLLQAADIGLLDGAAVVYSKLYMSVPTDPNKLDTSAGGTPWFTGNIAEIDPVGRLSMQVKVACGLQYLDVQMPRNVYQAGCQHTVYDAGCTLLKSLFTKTGTVSSSTDTATFNTSLTDADGFYNLGVLTFTSGANTGFNATVKSFAHTGGAFQVLLPFPKTIQPGDTFSVYPGCDRLQSTCQNKFNNLAHFKATPYVPVTETLYDGGTNNSSLTNLPAQQLGAFVGSGASARILPQ